MGLLSAIYSAALSGRKLFYKTGFKKTKKLPAKVISIGNLTLGGTGKTPAVIAVAQEAKNQGFKPCILTRGYKGKAKGPCLITRNELNDRAKNSLPVTRHLSLLFGDEPLLMAYRLEKIPVVKGKNRFLAGIYALGEFGSDAINMFILDDGFQHWGLYRDVDILLIDAANPFGNGKLFPEGILREPLNSIKRADTIVITKADIVSKELIQASIQRIKLYNPEASIYTASHKPTALVDASGESKSLDSLKNKRIYVFTGIADPSYFKALLKSKGADIIQFKTFRDHYNYKQRDINKMKKEASGLEIITTEKDLVKIKELKLPKNISALRIEFSIGEAFYDHIFDILFKRIS